MSKCNSISTSSIVFENSTPFDSWGISTAVDLKDCSLELITNSDYIYKFVHDLVNFIDMKAFGEPQIVHFGDNDKVAGYSMTQLIETSLISAHFANASSRAYIDIFSCKAYDAESAAEFCKNYFKASEVKYTSLVRD
jgi:S-adenosylmethionine/arginine decarboxylase-like enzyme